MKLHPIESYPAQSTETMEHDLNHSFKWCKEKDVRKLEDITKRALEALFASIKKDMDDRGCVIGMNCDCKICGRGVKDCFDLKRINEFESITGLKWEEILEGENE